jgi:hypothetical protein
VAAGIPSVENFQRANASARLNWEITGAIKITIRVKTNKKPLPVVFPEGAWRNWNTN